MRGLVSNKKRAPGLIRDSIEFLSRKISPIIKFITYRINRIGISKRRTGLFILFLLMNLSTLSFSYKNKHNPTEKLEDAKGLLVEKLDSIDSDLESTVYLDDKERAFILDSLATTLRQEGMEEWRVTFILNLIAPLPIDELKQRAEEIGDAAPDLASFIRTLEQVGMGEYQIPPILELIAPLDNIKERIFALKPLVGKLKKEGLKVPQAGSVLKSIAPLPIDELKQRAEEIGDAAPDLASFIRTLEQVGMGEYQIPPILELIAPLDNIKERIFALKHLIEIFQRTDRGIGDIYSVLYSVSTVSPIADMELVVNKLVSAILHLPETEEERKRINDKITKEKEQGLFSRSILQITSNYMYSGAKGTCFVAGKIRGSYVIIATTHQVVKGDKYTLFTGTEPRDTIGTPFLVLQNIEDEPVIGDFSIFIINEKDVRGGKLTPIDMVSGVKEGELSVMVSGSNDNVLTGHLIAIGDAVVLVGRDKAIPGDSGGPILVKKYKGYGVVGVLAKKGPVGMLFTSRIIKMMLEAVNQQEASNFKVCTEDSLQIDIIREFLEGLKGSWKEPIEESEKETDLWGSILIGFINSGFILFLFIYNNGKKNSITGVNDEEEDVRTEGACPDGFPKSGKGSGVPSGQNIYCAFGIPFFFISGADFMNIAAFGVMPINLILGIGAALLFGGLLYIGYKASKNYDKQFKEGGSLNLWGRLINWPVRLKNWSQ